MDNGRGKMMDDKHLLESSLILEHRFQIHTSEKAVKDILESVDGRVDLIIEKILWETAWQCNDYFPSADFFGMTNPASETGRVQLVNAPDMYFDYICRKIVLNNVLLDVFTTLGRKLHFGRKVHEPKYLSLYDDCGYYQIERLVDESGNIKSAEEARRKIERYEKEMSVKGLDGEERGNAELDSLNGEEGDKAKSDSLDEKKDKRAKVKSGDFKQWYKKRSNHYTDDVAKSLRKSEFVKEWKEVPRVAKYISSFEQKKAGEKVFLPLYDCQLLSLIYNNRRFLSNISEVLSDWKDDSSILRFIEDLEKITANAAKICPSDINGDGKRLDAVMLKYQTEKYFHYELLQKISQVKRKLKREHFLQNPNIEQALLNFAYGNIHMGAEYILKYPLKYISSSSIEQRLDKGSTLETAKSSVVNVWTQLYIEYLGIFSFVTVPVVRMALEANLYMLARNIRKGQDEDLDTVILKLLERYLKESDDFWNIDYYYLKREDKSYDGRYLLSQMRVSRIEGYEKVHSEYMAIAMQKKWKNYFERHRWFRFQSGELRGDVQLIQDAVLKWYEPNNYEKIYYPVLDSTYFGSDNDIDSMNFYRAKMIELNKEWIIKIHSN